MGLLVTQQDPCLLCDANVADRLSWSKGVTFVGNIPSDLMVNSCSLQFMYFGRKGCARFVFISHILLMSIESFLECVGSASPVSIAVVVGINCA